VLEMPAGTMSNPMPALAHLHFFLVIRAVRAIASNMLVKDRSGEWPRGFVARHLPGSGGHTDTTVIVEPAELHRAANRSFLMVRLFAMQACVRKPSVVSQAGMLEVHAGAIPVRQQ